MGKRHDRRQFIVGAAATGAAIVAGGIPKSGRACPVHYDEQGMRVEYFCLDDRDKSGDPLYWKYIFKSCDTSQTFEVVGFPGDESIGDCGNAANDPNCMTTEMAENGLVAAGDGLWISKDIPEGLRSHAKHFIRTGQVLMLEPHEKELLDRVRSQQ